MGNEAIKKDLAMHSRHLHTLDKPLNGGYGYTSWNVHSVIMILKKCDRTRFRHFLTCTSCAYFGFIKTTGFVARVGIAILRVNATVVFNVPV